MEKIGLVAGQGELPIIFSRAAKQRGDSVIAFCLKGVTDEGISGHVDKVHWFDWGELQKAIFVLATERIRKVVMLGKVKKDVLFKEDVKLDEKARELLKKAGDRKDYSILKGVSNALKVIGVEIMDPSPYLKELVPSKGLLTSRKPTKEESEDMEYGRSVAKELSRFDIGQTVVIKNKTIIAMEAVEGTDETIKRAGSLCKGGFVVVKVSRPNQDMRFDIPLVGLQTVRTLIDAGGSALALEENKTFLMDREEIIKLADEKGVSIVVI